VVPEETGGCMAVVTVGSDQTGLEPHLHNEIRALSDPRIRAFCTWVLEDVARDYFWSAPASMIPTAPSWARSEGGLVVYTRVVCRFTTQLAYAYGVDGENFDVLLGAAIVHDVRRWGRAGPRSGRYVEYQKHDFLMVREVRKRLGSMGALGKLKEDDGRLGRLLRVCETHLGPWSKGRKKMGTLLQRILFEAAYLAGDQVISEVQIPTELGENPW